MLQSFIHKILMVKHQKESLICWNPEWEKKLFLLAVQSSLKILLRIILFYMFTKKYTDDINLMNYQQFKIKSLIVMCISIGGIIAS